MAPPSLDQPLHKPDKHEKMREAQHFALGVPEPTLIPPQQPAWLNIVSTESAHYT
jgi:hypothetical protein